MEDDTEIPSQPNETGDDVPVSIFFFVNGMVACCNAKGEQIPKYQGKHDDAVEALKADGYNWAELPEVMGYPGGPYCSTANDIAPTDFTNIDASYADK